MAHHGEQEPVENNSEVAEPAERVPHAEHGGSHEPLRTKEEAHHNKHHRQMHRTLRWWPVHSNTPRITF